MDNGQQIFLQLLLTTIQGVGGQELQYCVPLSFACFFFKQDRHYRVSTFFLKVSKCGRFQYSACKQPNKEHEIAKIFAADMFSMMHLRCFDA